MTFSSFPRLIHKQWSQASQVAQWVKNLPAVEEVQTDTSLIPRLGRSPGRGHENPLQYSRLENPMDRGSWWATVHRVAKSWTWLKWLSTRSSELGELSVLLGVWAQLFNRDQSVLKTHSFSALAVHCVFPFVFQSLPSLSQSGLTALESFGQVEEMSQGDTPGWSKSKEVWWQGTQEVSVQGLRMACRRDDRWAGIWEAHGTPTTEAEV